MTTVREECVYLQGAVWRETYMTKDTYRNLVALICINLLSVIPTVLLNALVIIAVATRRRLRTNSNILLACLAGTDLLTGLVVQPIGIAVEVKRLLGVGPFCTVEKLSVVTLSVVCFASFSHLVLISIDRYIAIKHSLRYQDIVTPQRIKTGVVLVWAISALVTIEEIVLAETDKQTNIYSVYFEVTTLISAGIFSVYTAVIVYTYYYIFLETRRQKNRLQTELISHEEAKRIKKDRKAAITPIIILGALVLTYLPIIICALVMASSVDSRPFLSVYGSWCTTFVSLGSLFNPIIYCWRIKKLRRAFLEILHYRQPENRAPDIEMIEIQRHRPEIQRQSTCEAFSMPVVRQEPVLLSFCHLKAEEIVHIEEIDN